MDVKMAVSKMDRYLRGTIAFAQEWAGRDLDSLHACFRLPRAASLSGSRPVHL